MLIALARRLGGNTVAAENALRDAVSRHTRCGSTDKQRALPGDINLEIPKLMLDKWREDPSHWLTDACAAATEWLHDRKIHASMIGPLAATYGTCTPGLLACLALRRARHGFDDED